MLRPAGRRWHSGYLLGLLPFAMSPTPDSPERDPDFDRELEAVETRFQQFKQRYQQVRRDGDLRWELRQELQRLQEQLEELELRLESQLFSWRELREPFWQAVRFLGLGVVVGWILKSCAG
jgi:predicted RNase H-like nuclease (RuvC/YqgF family)